MDVEIVEVPEQRAGVIRSDMAHISEAMGQLWAIVGPSGLMGQRGVVPAAVMPVDVFEQRPGESARYDAAIIVPEPIAIPEGLVEERIPGGRYARAVHTGPYEGLGETWGAFTGQWLTESGNTLRDGVCFEVYRDSPADTPEADLRTELYIPIE
jgi:AraC family transcriptional regulator